MIAIAEHAEGCVLPVRAQPGARKAGVLGEQAGALKVAVTAPPVDGEANAAVIEVLAKALGIARSAIAVVGGASSRRKRVEIQGVTLAQIEALCAGS